MVMYSTANRKIVVQFHSYAFCIAQMEEQRAFNAEVLGSNPSANKSVAQLVERMAVNHNVIGSIPVWFEKAVV